VQYWLDKKSLYAPGAMKAAYGTFLTSLLVIKCHDMVADQAASEFNVTWTRTTPIVVYCVDDAISTYITGASSLRMGMDVNGTASNVWAFRFACSSAFSPIEYMVAGNSTGLSVTLGLGERILNGEIPELFMSNGYLVYKIQGKDDLFLLLDPETGIVTDCAYGIHGAYCFHDQITDDIIERAEELNSTNPDIQNTFPIIIGSMTIGIAEGIPEIIALVEYIVAAGEAAAPYIASTMPYLGAASLVVLPFAILEAVNPQLIEQAEREGNFNSVEWYRQNFLDRWKDALQYILFQSGGWAVVLNEQNAYIDEINQPLYEQRDKEWQEFYDSIWGGINFLMENGEEELDDEQTTSDEFWAEQVLKNLG